jgi:hypothetical protein
MLPNDAGDDVARAARPAEPRVISAFRNQSNRGFSETNGICDNAVQESAPRMDDVKRAPGRQSRESLSVSAIRRVCVSASRTSVEGRPRRLSSLQACCPCRVLSVHPLPSHQAQKNQARAGDCVNCSLGNRRHKGGCTRRSERRARESQPEEAEDRGLQYSLHALRISLDLECANGLVVIRVLQLVRYGTAI